MLRIEIIGQVGTQTYAAEQIMAIYDEGTRIATQHGETFTGRPTTQLMVTSQHVIKLRTEYNLPLKDSRRFIERALEKERSLDIYHPAKTWFLLEQEDGNPLICNITPRLAPLHDPQAMQRISTEIDFTQMLCTMFRMYLRIASEHDMGLDISLSNFALDRDLRLYYIDDDIYSWDKFTTLSHYLGTLIRSQSDLDDEKITNLGICLRESILEYFSDQLWLSVIAEETRGIFLPETKRPILMAFIKALNESRQVVRKISTIDTSSPVPKSKVIALLADVHANAPALETALNYLAKRNINQGLVMGDVVGYGPHPRECIRLLRDNPGFSVIKGNHDHAASGLNYGMGFSHLGKWVIEWTANLLNDEEKNWLAELPLYLLGENWIAVHGAPTDKTFFNAYVYQMTYEENLDNLEKRQLKFGFHGHTHLQKTYFRTRRGDGHNDAPKQQLADYQSALVCPGSVGQPRSNIPGCELALVDTETWELEYLRLDYDMQPTLNDMQRENFPPNLIERLTLGK